MVRVVATGRSLYSAQQVLSPSAPLDYLVFSSGAGIVDWGQTPCGAPIHSRSLTEAQVHTVVAYCLAQRLSFMVHAPAPDSHRFGHLALQAAPDFERRLSRYAEYAHPLERIGGGVAWNGPASQVLVLPPAGDSMRMHAHAVGALPEFNVVRTTSPLDGRSLWLEVFPRGVSKASACQWLAERLHIAADATYAVGNDYNDEALLAWAAHARVVGNAPQPLRERYGAVSSHDEHGASHAARVFGLLEP